MASRLSVVGVVLALATAASRPCTIRRVSANEWTSGTEPVLEPVLVRAEGPTSAGPAPEPALDALTDLKVQVIGNGSVDSMLYSQFGRGSVPATLVRFGTFAANSVEHGDAMVFSLSSDVVDAVIGDVVPPRLAARAGRALEQASLSKAAKPCSDEGDAAGSRGSQCRADSAEDVAHWQSLQTPLVSAGWRRAGLRLHQHGAAWLHLLAGRKQWWLAHPESDIFSAEIDHARASAVALASVSDEAQWPPPAGTNATSPPLCFVEQQPGELLFVPAMWFHATRNTGDRLVVGIGAQTVLSSLPYEAAQAEVAALQRAFPRCGRLEAYRLEGVERPTLATAERLAALVRRDPWHLPTRLTLLRHAIAVGERTRFQVAVDAAVALKDHVKGCVARRHAAMGPLDAQFVLSSAAELLYDAARAQLGPSGVTSAATKTLFTSSAQLQNVARALLEDSGDGMESSGRRTGTVAALPRQHRAAWLDSVRSEAVSSYAAGAHEALRSCIGALSAVPPDDSDDVAGQARAVAKALSRGLGGS
jgi:hypothetical protein